MNRLCCVAKLLRELNLRMDFNSFKSRLLAQKVVYVAQTLLNIDLGYKFIWHIRGPYSKALSRDLRMLDKVHDCSCVELGGGALLRLKSLLGELRGVSSDLSYTLEILASYLMLVNEVYPKPDDPLKELISRKPYVRYEDAVKVLSVMNKYLGG